MNPAVFEIDRSKKGGQALYELLKSSMYAKLIEQKRSRVRMKKYEYTFNDLNGSTQEAFSDADMGRTHKSKDLDDLFDQLEI